MARFWAILSFVACVVLASSEARAQNTDSFFFSDEAALTAGAMTAVPGDPGAIWYNAAGLGALRHARATVSGSVFGVRVRPVPKALTVRAGGAQSSLDLPGTDFIATPTAVTVSLSPVPKFVLGGGLFTTGREIRSGAAQQVLTTPGGAILKQRLTLLQDDKRLHAGGAFGFDAGHGLRVGAGMFGVYTTHQGAADYAVGLTPPGRGEEVIASSTRIGRKTWGLQATGGIQWDASRQVHFGLQIRMPELMISSSVDDDGAVITGGPQGSRLEVYRNTAPSQPVQWIEPTHVQLGFAIEPCEPLRLAMDFDLAIGVDSDMLGPPPRTVLNARAGALIHALDSLDLGVGAFYDLATDRELDTFVGATRLTFVGGTAGATWRTKLRVGDDPRPDAFVLGLTLAVRYAAGIGEARQTIVEDQRARGEAVDLVTHDVMPYTGLAVLF